MKKCEHICSSNCRREGCNCECGEFHRVPLYRFKCEIVDETDDETVMKGSTYVFEDRTQNIEEEVAELLRHWKSRREEYEAKNYSITDEE